MFYSFENAIPSEGWLHSSLFLFVLLSLTFCCCCFSAVAVKRKIEHTEENNRMDMQEGSRNTMSTERKTIGWTCKREVDEKVECKQSEETQWAQRGKNRLDMQECKQSECKEINVIFLEVFPLLTLRERKREKNRSCRFLHADSIPLAFFLLLVLTFRCCCLSCCYAQKKDRRGKERERKKERLANKIEV